MKDFAGRTIVITNKCADDCADVFDHDGPEQARKWLLDLISTQGEFTNQLPAKLAGRRSPSGYFVLVAGKFLLPLAQGDGESQWITTNCIALHNSKTSDYDKLFRLSGRKLLEHCNITVHAVERFQQRGGGHPEPQIAHQQLINILTPTVRLSRKRPAWSGARQADFFLIAGEFDEFYLPCQIGSRPGTLDAVTLVHRAIDIFNLQSTQLFQLCRIEPNNFPPGGKKVEKLTRAFQKSGQLVWHRPEWAPQYHAAKWWIVFRGRVAAPVEWFPLEETKPLHILDLVDRRPMVVRFISWLWLKIKARQKG